MFYFEVTPENRILLELLVVVFAAMIALIIENPGAPSEKTETATSTLGKVVPGH